MAKKTIEIRYGRVSVSVEELYGRRGTALQVEIGGDLFVSGGEVMLPHSFFPEIIGEEAWEKAIETDLRGGHHGQAMGTYKKRI